MKLWIDVDEKLMQKAKANTGILSDAELIKKALHSLSISNPKSDISLKDRLRNQAKILELAGKVEFFEGYPDLNFDNYFFNLKYL